MRVTHSILTIRTEVGGPSYCVPATCAALAEEGVDVDLAVWEKRGEPRPLDEEHRITVTNGSPHVMVTGNMRLRALASHLQNNGTQILHDNSVWRMTHIAVALAAKRLGIPLVLSPHGNLTTWCLNDKRLKKKVAMNLYMRRVLEQVDVFHATSEDEVEGLRALNFRQPIALIPLGTKVPDDDFVSSGRDGNSGKVRTALYLSRLHHKKGLPMLVEAWDNLRPEGWQLLIIGPGEEDFRAQVIKQIEQCGLTDVISVHNEESYEQVWQRYNEADLFILPTHSESFGLVIAEALACGTPVLTTKGTPWPELISHNCGWWTDIGVEPIQHALEEATNMPTEELRAMGMRGRELVKEKYSWSYVARQLIQVYDWILGSGDKPATIVAD